MAVPSLFDGGSCAAPRPVSENPATEKRTETTILGGKLKLRRRDRVTAAEVCPDKTGSGRNGLPRAVRQPEAHPVGSSFGSWLLKLVNTAIIGDELGNFEDYSR